MQSTNHKKGFTLLEMLVCITIITIIFRVLLGSNKTYSERLNLKNQSYNVLLYLRQAQVYSLAVKGFVKAGNPTTFDVSYGVSTGNTSQNTFSFFTDQNLNGKYAATEAHQDYALTQGIFLKKLCGYNAAGTVETCPMNLDRIDITFKRPNSSATINFLKSNGTAVPNIFPPAEIYLSSPSAYSVVIKVDSTGGISIQ